MVKSVLDTDILSEYLKGHDPTVIRHAAHYAQEHRVITFTSVTVYEIVYGLELKGASSQLKKALAWLNQNEQIAPIAADYLTAATIKAAARRIGSSLELPDCPIAAVAVRLDRPLVTGNTEDFRAIRKTGINLIIENWRTHSRRCGNTSPTFNVASCGAVVWSAVLGVFHVSIEKQTYENTACVYSLRLATNGNEPGPQTTRKCEISSFFESEYITKACSTGAHTSG